MLVLMSERLASRNTDRVSFPKVQKTGSDPVVVPVWFHCGQEVDCSYIVLEDPILYLWRTKKVTCFADKLVNEGKRWLTISLYITNVGCCQLWFD